MDEVITSKVNAFCALAVKAGYASAVPRASGCVVLVMPKDIARKQAEDLFNAVEAMLKVSGIAGSIRSLPSDGGSAVVVQAIALDPEADKKSASVDPVDKPPAGELPADEPPAEKTKKKKA